MKRTFINEHINSYEFECVLEILRNYDNIEDLGNNFADSLEEAIDMTEILDLINS